MLNKGLVWEENADPRVIRSKTAIQDALLSLIAEKEYNKITVTDITKRAGLARPTFYLHYKTKEDVLSEIYFKWLIPLYEKHLRIWKVTFDDIERETVVKQVYLWHQEHREIVMSLFQAGCQDVLLKFSEIAIQNHLRNLEEIYQVELPQPLFKLITYYVAGAFSSLLIYWMTSERQLNLEAIVKEQILLVGTVYDFVFLRDGMKNLYSISTDE